MDVNISESTRGVRDSVSAFADEIEGELEKVSIFGVHLTRRVTITVLGVFTIVCVAIGVSFGVDFSSAGSVTNQKAFSKDHRYWLLGEVLESSIGRDIYDNTTHEHESLIWLANSDPMQLDTTSSMEDILQRFVAANIYFAAYGAEWTEQFNFLSKKDVCEWNDQTSGIFCNEKNQVTNITLRDCNLKGTIPNDIGLLSNMESINLGKNGLHGTIPVQIGMMSSLTDIDLHKNELSGKLPESLAMLQNLVLLRLSFNSLEGSDGASALKDLPNLEEIHLSHNKLEGNIGTFEKSARLSHFDISHNMIDGTIPEDFGDGNKLTTLKLESNQIEGTIPGTIANLKGLVELDISDNKLTGSLPSALGDLWNLQSLKLNSNNLQFGLPAELGYLYELKTFEIAENGINSIPVELFGLIKLEVLYLSVNRISGPLPPEIGRATSLVELDLANNKFSQPLPSEVGDLSNLEYLYLNDNEFDGSIPSELSSLTLLRELDISNNNFFGSMESQFCGDRSDSGNPIDRFRADCLIGGITLSCATDCCDGNSYCCDMPDQTECKMQDYDYEI